jgi:hypothetical protein
MDTGPNELHQLVELARARHQALLEDANRYRQLQHGLPVKPQPLRRLRIGAGDLLINAGLWLKTGAIPTS